MKNKIWSNEKIRKYEGKRKIFILVAIISFCLMFVMPLFFFVGIYFLILSYGIKIQRRLRDELDKENDFIRQGYKKVCKGFFVNDEEHKLNILDETYGFSQIVDCELIEDGTSISQTTGKTKIKNSKKAKTKYRTTQWEICTNLGVNITTTNFNNPRIMFDCKYGKTIYKNSNAYKEAINNAQNIISTLKIVISKNNEKYIETGTITKIEHKYITEENASIQIERLSQLHKDGVLTDYEFEMKKKELLDKMK